MIKNRSNPVVYIVCFVLLVITSCFILFVLPKMFESPASIYIGSGVFKANVADDSTSRAKGLSGVYSMDSDEALLMIFPTEDDWGIWMKDMKIPIDIVWLDGNKKVIYIVKNASPYVSTLTTYRPNDPAKYVVEFPAGTVDNYNIAINSLAIFQTDSEGM